MQESILKSLRDALGGDVDGSAEKTFEKGKAAGFVIGSDGNAEAALMTLDKLGVSPIFIMARDSRDMYLMINKYRNIDLQGLRGIGMARRELEDLQAKNITLCIGVVAVPTPPAEFPSQQIVYDIAKVLLASSYTPAPGGFPAYMALPAKPLLLDAIIDISSGVVRHSAKEAGWEMVEISRDGD